MLYCEHTGQRATRTSVKLVSGSNWQCPNTLISKTLYSVQHKRNFTCRTPFSSLDDDDDDDAFLRGLDK